ncbi:hypothetical protein A2955_00995 [Candidatus Woesebacteria bacterium RIFCSPLOWO2_01_FULL_37_19]|uniref:Methyltransferase type 11 domain-containing protein n=2 Tax=Candidatus Woeseibacteriota TaxID=1752722 RepID=A0A1F8B882_9BACT|nr:MAG: hypothetical protein A2771_00885 [Candidatus Woesebacteria bacterium RIFCSPHIGHO2_01_FULL_38_26b]OGM60242.1 MAG: hypothetical protein A2955_00995 [Candidatus Woesebacteria bacterium RIFCSPLOWO2_01_FULL_37_19]
MPKGKIKKVNSKLKWGGTHPFFLHSFVSNFTPPNLENKVILDVGCGKGINAYLIRVTRDLSGSTLVGLDINKDYLDFCKKFNIYDNLVKQNLPKLPFKDKSIDFLLCTEVIEHLKKKDGEKLLKEIDRVCRGRALITTPNVVFGTIPNKYEDSHNSDWRSPDFRGFGYKVYGIGFKTTVLHNDPLLKIKQALYFFATPFAYFIPQISGILVCVKDY